jgi:hypothetical protein
MTTLDIFNKALAAIGRTRFLSSTASTFVEGVHCRAEWDGARQAVLSAHEWGWLAVQLPMCNGSECVCEATGQPAYNYPRPPDALRIAAVMDAEGGRVKWQAVNGVIQSPVEAVAIRYIPDSDDPTGWPSAIVDAVVYELAARIAIPLTRDGQLAKAMKQGSLLYLGTAVSRDSSEVKYGGDTENRYAKARR